MYAFIVWLCVSAPLSFVFAMAVVRWLHLPAPLAMFLFLTGISTVFAGLSAIAFVALRLRLIRRPDGKLVFAVKPPKGGVS